ncbi:hypothetical protein Y032_0017g3219 [Ancylostoma ceylanicum]|uniref:Uncharacterized protein n=1 Tax=Ancylostoma ceylanicum TaxID=53326 RepID=A0A016V441_9BILA|nr:hypothetical protein Y032_0017g3219 [Ancylostoma ceylanicum]
MIRGTAEPDRRRTDGLAWLWTDEVKVKVRENKRLHHVFLDDKKNDNWQKYREAKNAVKKAVAATKAEHYGGVGKHLDEKDGVERLYLCTEWLPAAERKRREVLRGQRRHGHLIILDRKKDKMRWCDYSKKISTE